MKINRWWFVTVVSVLCAAFFSTSTSQNVEPPPLVYLGSNSQGAVCLDGSSPAYSIDPGSGSGQNSWIVHLEGGGWCGSLDDCLQRSLTDLGSSKYMTAYGFGGFLSNSPSVNPGFYNWNRVLVRYCDGGSFAGNADSGVQVTSNGGTTTLYFRGQAVWEAVIDDLLTKGLASADKAILSGDSAGGSAAFFQCNRFKEKLSSQTDVKCLCDAGFFMDIPNLAGEYSFREFFQYVVTLHQITLLPSGCTSQMSLGQCYFPEYNLAYINVPLFFVQSPYDNFQVRYILAPPSSYSNGSWDACKQDLASCSSSQISTIQDQLSGVMLKALSPLVGSQNWGMYMASCYYHTEVTDDTLWNGMTTVSGLVQSHILMEKIYRMYAQKRVIKRKKLCISLWQTRRNYSRPALQTKTTSTRTLRQSPTIITTLLTRTS